MGEEVLEGDCVFVILIVATRGGTAPIRHFLKTKLMLSWVSIFSCTLSKYVRMH